MLEILETINIVFTLILIFVVYRRVKPAPSIPVEGVDLDSYLNELHAMSRNTGARVHIHDIESVLRRTTR